MAIVKLNCESCHKSFEVDDEKINWEVKNNWFSRVEYRIAYCPECGCENYIDWIERFNREEE